MTTTIYLTIEVIDEVTYFTGFDCYENAHTYAQYRKTGEGIIHEIIPVGITDTVALEAYMANALIDAQAQEIEELKADIAALTSLQNSN